MLAALVSIANDYLVAEFRDDRYVHGFRALAAPLCDFHPSPWGDTGASALHLGVHLQFLLPFRIVLDTDLIVFRHMR